MQRGKISSCFRELSQSKLSNCDEHIWCPWTPTLGTPWRGVTLDCSLDFLQALYLWASSSLCLRSWALQTRKGEWRETDLHVFRLLWLLPECAEVFSCATDGIHLPVEPWLILTDCNLSLVSFFSPLLPVSEWFLQSIVSLSRSHFKA